jgi:hypothetical protein
MASDCGGSRDVSAGLGAYMLSSGAAGGYVAACWGRYARGNALLGL